MKVQSKMTYCQNAKHLKAIILIAAASLFSTPMAMTAIADEAYQTQSMMIVAQNNAPSKGGQRPGPPPKEAISACQDVAENARCSFNDARAGQQVDGICHITPRGDAACVPDNAPAPKG